eukprot:1707842-Rhodomonas_salina.1
MLVCYPLQRRPMRPWYHHTLVQYRTSRTVRFLSTTVRVLSTGYRTPQAFSVPDIAYHTRSVPDMA